jgi:hypothetical protein
MDFYATMGPVFKAIGEFNKVNFRYLVHPEKKMTSTLNLVSEIFLKIGIQP